MKFIFDIGSSGIRVGCAQDQLPLTEIPTTIGISNDSSDAGPEYFLYEDRLDIVREDMECYNCMENGMVEHWDMLEKIFDYVYDDFFRSVPSYHPVLISQCPWNCSERSQTLTEIMFEKYNVPELLLAKNSSLVPLAVSKSTGLVIDCGASTTSVVPVIDGVTRNEALFASPIAGNFLNKMNKIPILPPYTVGNKQPTIIGNYSPPKVTKSWYNYQMETHTQVIKDAILEVSEIPILDPEAELLITPMSYDFPYEDNNTRILGVERYKMAEEMFNPSPYVDKYRIRIVRMGLGQMVVSCLDKLDEISRKRACKKIFLTGGASSMKGFKRRLLREISLKLPHKKMTIFSVDNCSGRRYQAWTGGAKLALSSAFEQLSMTRAEFEEHGKDYADIKFF